MEFILLLLPFLPELVALFAVSVAVIYVCHRIKLVPIAGFLIAGVLIGPWGLGLVYEPDLVNALAEIGVILLLFTIGMEFSLEQLSRIARAIFLGGTIQVLLTTLVVVSLLSILGTGLGEGIFTGFLVSLSSTAIVISLLSQRGEIDTPAGRLSLAFLIFQDLAVVAMVLVVPFLSGTWKTSGEILFALGKAVVLIGVTVFLARRVVPWILEHVAQTRSQELFLLTVVAICFGVTTLTSLADVSLSLGAFLAGLVVSESRYKEHALSEMFPLRTIFTAVFFVSVGMLLDFRILLAEPWLVAGVAVAIIVLKFGASAGSVLILGYPRRIAVIVGLALAQVGEFSFVLERAGSAVGLSPAGLGEAGEQTFLAVTVLLMLATPLLFQSGLHLGSAMATATPDRLSRSGTVSDLRKPVALADHVVIVGYGAAGRHLVHLLREAKIDYVVVEINPSAVREMRREGIHAIYGDAGKTHIQKLAGVEHAKALVVVINDEAMIPRIIPLGNLLNPTLQTIARIRYVADMDHLHSLGADIIVAEEMETTARIVAHVLGAYMTAPEEVDRLVRLLREDDYRIVRGSIQEAHLMVLQGLDENGLHTRAVGVRQGSPAVGKTLMDLDMRKKHGLTVIAVRRQGTTKGNPAGDFMLQAGDRLIIIGTPENFTLGADLFRPPAPQQPPPNA
jgi:CPA2 family monovalent cation:H+ antiporter-2